MQADQLPYEHVPFKVVRTFRVRLVEAGRLGPRVVEPFVDESEG